jgi:hypothetical protein
MYACKTHRSDVSPGPGGLTPFEIKGLSLAVLLLRDLGG